jgi:chaperonin GroEL
MISEDLGHKLEDITLNTLGQVHKAIINKDETTIVANEESAKAVEGRCKQIQSEIQETSSSYDKSKLEERLARLSGGIAILRVGGDNELIMKERKDRLEDAKNAAKAALEEGAVPGGGKALLECFAHIDINELIPDSLKVAERVGAKIILDALKAPISQILRNAGLDSSVIIDKLLAAKEPNRIFDVVSENFVDAYEAGIIDPLKVIRLAFKNAAKIGESIVSTAALIVNKPAESKDRGGMPSAGGMMGGGGHPGMMDDMDF